MERSPAIVVSSSQVGTFIVVIYHLTSKEMQNFMMHTNQHYGEKDTPKELLIKHTFVHNILYTS